MISKLANPRYFKKVKTKPVEYVNSSQAWMTSVLFENRLLKIDKKFKKQKLEIILLMDNSTAHNYVPLMENVKVNFFPPNMTSIIKPMDQEIIRNFKHFYRRFLFQCSHNQT